ncbi:MliC family protein [Roseateles violae]|uniref:MliC family protein n=1 Tax=Roseateles violae TaxID=3058042 RepID=A0ABT8DS88_9BURK|nr:MliC family protein [Pelomonas sp. PFR6]MDN3921192.1 MliC family protein [Pelomonas sp. PFR6]
MRKTSGVSLLLPLLAACAAPTPPGEAAGERRVHYACANGESLEMRFLGAQGIGLLLRQGETIELRQQVAGSGFLYANGPTTVRGKGSELIVEIGRMAPITCTVR